MSKVIKLKIMTPEKIIYQNDILEITLPTEAGELTLLPDHMPLVTIAKTGEMRLKNLDGEMLPMSISGGIVEVRGSDNDKNIETEIIILAFQAELATEIDIYRAEEAYGRAVKAMEEAQNEKDIDFAKFQALIDKELNRVRVAKKWRK
jgi:F-type H+-transporting ATPase subunit epsilon